MRDNESRNKSMEVCEQSMGNGRDLCGTIDAATGENEIEGGDYGNDDASIQVMSAGKTESVGTNEYDKYLPATKRRP